MPAGPGRARRTRRTGGLRGSGRVEKSVNHNDCERQAITHIVDVGQGQRGQGSVAHGGGGDEMVVMENKQRSA